MAMAVSFAIGSYIEGGVVTGIIFLNVIIGCLQEFNAEKTMDSLRSLSSPTATVVRNGNTEVVPTAEIVFGDLVEVKVGDTIPADIRYVFRLLRRTSLTRCRLVEAMNFETDEALLTGESLPVAKEATATFPAETGPGDRLNIIYSSSTVTKGRGRGVVFATGMRTEIGSIAAALRGENTRTRSVKRKADGTAKPHRYVEAWGLTASDFIGRFLGVNVGTPLQRKLSRLAILLFGVAVVFAIIVMAANGFSDERDVIIYAVATGLSMIPASLVVILTITMAAGTRSMVKRNVVVRKLDALEALGGVTDICSDKTGTLTQGKMVVKKAWLPSKGTYTVGLTENPIDPTIGEISHVSSAPESKESDEKAQVAPVQDLLNGNEDLVEFLNIASLANLANVHKAENEWKARGDPTEIAIQVFASRFDWNRLRFTEGDKAMWKQNAEYPFDSSIKKMSVIFTKTSDVSRMVFTKGAVERVLESCTTIRTDADSKASELTDDIKSHILANMEALAAQGLRVLALASKPWTADVEPVPDRASVENNLIFRGLVGLYDPPRPETAGAVSQCHKAGIAVHMLTGDHPATARAIAIQVGILPRNMRAVPRANAEAMVMTAAQFDALTDTDIDSLPLLPLVIARCSPNTKVRMIEALHRRSCFAAMTGDGVNDSPSLKRADVGIAMGLAGSDVAKDASDIVLTDDNFASILNAVEEGRRMFDNIQKFVLHLLSQNIAQALVLLIGLVFKDSDGRSVFPLAPVEILWIIMITSGLPDMGLGFEKASSDIMERPPHNMSTGIFTWEILFDMVVYGLWMAALCLTAFTLVLFAFGNANLGTGTCNDTFSGCETVFRARATTFACLTWFSVFLAWEMMDSRRSFFNMHPSMKRPFTQWIGDIWQNQFLFWSVMAGFITIFPTLYIPVINHDVFKHEGISWEWGIVFVESFLFFLGVEGWKWWKRVWFRWRAHKMGFGPRDLEMRAFERYLSTDTGFSGGSGSGEKK